MGWARINKTNLLGALFLLGFLYLNYTSIAQYRPKKPSTLKNVPVDLFVMSKCPDAVYCESVFTEVVKKVGPIMELDMNYIGKINETNSKYGVDCMHGDSECLGNIQELCAHKVAPDTWYQFVLCLNEDFRSIGLPESNLDICLKRSLVPVQPFKECVEEGAQLLKTSVTRSANLGMRKSCTILINKGHHKCVHDGTWKECSGGHTAKDFIKQICDAYQGPAIPPCQSVGVKIKSYAH